MARPSSDSSEVKPQPGYRGLLAGVASLLEEARKGAARTVNSIVTATYWEIGRRIVDHEQQGKAKPGYGEQVIERLAPMSSRCASSTCRFGTWIRHAPDMRFLSRWGKCRHRLHFFPSQSLP